MVQTVPPNSAPVCPGGRLVFTCTTDNSGLQTLNWRGDSGTERATASDDRTISIDSFNVIAALVNGVVVSSTATNESVPVQLNGKSIACSDTAGLSYSTLIINVTGMIMLFAISNVTMIILAIPGEAVSNVTIDPITNNGVIVVTWNTPSDPCIDHYNVAINSNNSNNGSRTTNNTNITVNDLIIGTNYSFIIIPIDTIGREGPPSSLIQYIWNGKNYTHTHTHSLYFL